MKILGISIVILVFLIGFSLVMDILLGFDLYTSIHNNLNPFLVMEVPELVLFFFLIIYLLAASARRFFKKKKKGTDKDNKYHQSKK
ncbi:hypothetical protein [Jeotgalibacillus malaysiensis]|uniref:hypothetical protein n=1 Tax=Jeotgalibacillus malaysiensis TaxID=1508404 RepID=UPI0038509293